MLPQEPECSVEYVCVVVVCMCVCHCILCMCVCLCVLCVLCVCCVCVDARASTRNVAHKEPGLFCATSLSFSQLVRMLAIFLTVNTYKIALALQQQQEEQQQQQQQQEQQQILAAAKCSMAGICLLRYPKYVVLNVRCAVVHVRCGTYAHANMPECLRKQL